MKKIFLKMVTVLYLLCLVMPVGGYAATQDTIEKELKRRMDAIDAAYMDKDIKKGDSLSKELNDYIVMNKDKTIPVLLKIIKSDNEKFRYRSDTIRRMGELKIIEAIDTIALCVGESRSKHQQISVDAIRVLGKKFGDEKSIGYLLQYYKDYLDGKNRGRDRGHVISQLSRHRNEQTINVFIKALSDSEDFVREKAVKSLGKWKVKKAIKPIQKLLEIEKSPEVRTAAENSLSQSGTDLFIVH